MNRQQLIHDGTLRGERITDEEARDVIALWTREHVVAGGADAPATTTDVAEGLDISVGEAQRLLAEVRTRRVGAARREQENRRAALERAEAQARLAEAEARLAEAEARRVRAEAETRQVQNVDTQAAPWAPGHWDASRTFLAEHEKRNQARNLWGGGYNSMSLVVAVAIAMILLSIVVGGLLAPRGRPDGGGFPGDRPGESCTMDGKPVPCSMFPEEIRR